MRAWQVFGVTLLLAALPTALAVWVGHALASPVGPPHPPALPDSDRMHEVIDAFETRHVHVLDDGRSMVSEEQQAQLEEAAAKATWPTYVIVGQFSYDAGLPSLHLTASTLGWEREERAIYIIWQGPDSGLVWGHGLREDLDTPSFTGDVTTHVLAMLAELEENGSEPWDRKPDGGLGWGVFLGIVIGLPAAGVAAWGTSVAARQVRRIRDGG
ncbi:hypothetical protein [Nocardioides sp. AE5]|uniref:hypothetical protein n=1 Tax=Nocardioides sp. AE5 TaxID=2962573 RepID=UPI0028819657|nr:hypothetical protein [Nocardioides sp. AE5]MDT0201923.1 hypothetical protein [Nocardioides sp. AE5]